MRRCKLGIVLLAFSFLTVHFTCSKVFNFCPLVSSVFSSQVVYADTALLENEQEKVREYYKLARQYYKRGDYKRAIIECQKALEIDAYNTDARKLIKKSEKQLEKLKAKKVEEQREKEEQIEKQAEKQKQKKIAELFDVAKGLYSDKKYDETIAQCTEILKMDSDNKSAQKLIDKSEERIQIAKEKASKLAKQKAKEDTKKEAGLMTLQKKKIKERKQIEKEELENKIKIHYRDGKKLYRNDKYSDAIGEFKTVLVLDSAHEGAKEYLTASEESLKEQNERKSVRHAKTAKKEIARKERLRKRDIQDKITDAKIEADAGEYDESIKILESILPDVSDENLRRSVEFLISKVRTEKTVKEEKLTRKRLQTISDERMLEVAKAQLPPTEVKRMKELERKKKKVDASRELRDKASGIKVPLIDFKDMDLRKAILFLMKQTGVNINLDEAIFSGGASASAAPAAEQAEGWAGETATAAQSTGPINTRVTFYAKDLSLLSVLDAILRARGLDYKFAKEYIWVSTKARILSQPLEDLETRFYSLEYGAPMNVHRLTESEFKTGGGEAITIGHEEAGEGDGKVSAESVKELLEALVPQPTGASITVQSELNKLFVKNTPENLDKTEKILAELKTPAQVSIEARYVYVRLRKGEDIGIGFKEITADYNKNQAKPETTVKGVHGTSGTLHKTHTFTGDVLGGITGLGTTGLDLTYAAVLNRLQFTTYLKALQSRRDTNTLSAPKLTVINNKSGIVKFIRNQIYVDTVSSTTTAATSTTSAITTYNYTFTDRDVGMTLNVTPQINETTQCVTLYLQPVVSEIESWSTPYYADSTADPNSAYYKPCIYTKTVETWVTVHDGDTVVLGGFMEDTNTKDVYKVPFLSDIPLLGKLFQHKSKDEDKKKLLIFVTVNILDASGNARITSQNIL